MRRRVLIADSNVDGAETLAFLLQSNGHLALTAFTGPDVLTQAAVLHPDVALLAIHLPQMSGYEVCRRLRTGAHGAIPRFVIALTGNGRDSDRNATHEAGFDYHLVKPVDPELILTLLRM